MENFKHLKAYENFQELDYDVICDESCVDIVRPRYRHVYPCPSNSSLISRVRSILSKYPRKKIVIYIDDRELTPRSYDERVSFITEFIGKSDNYIIRKATNIR